MIETILWGGDPFFDPSPGNRVIIIDMADLAGRPPAGRRVVATHEVIHAATFDDLVQFFGDPARAVSHMGVVSDDIVAMEEVITEYAALRLVDDCLGGVPPELIDDSIEYILDAFANISDPQIQARVRDVLADLHTRYSGR